MPPVRLGELGWFNAITIGDATRRLCRRVEPDLCDGCAHGITVEGPLLIWVEGDDLDALYEDWLGKASAALGLPSGLPSNEMPTPERL